MQREEMREKMKFFSTHANASSKIGLVCVAAFLKLKELQKDSKRAHAQKYAIYQKLMKEVAANVEAVQKPVEATPMAAVG